jgi:putative flippase GtrA
VTIDDFPDHDEQIRPPAGMVGVPGPLLRIIRDQRVAFLTVGGMNTAIGAAWFVLFLWLVGGVVGYMGVLVCAHIAAVLCAFVLYRTFVFKVTGHVLRDLARFEVVTLFAVGINAALLPLMVEVFGWPVLLSQAIIVVAYMLISWFGHRGFSFRRTPAELDLVEKQATS